MLRRCGLSEIATPGWTVAEDVDAYAARGFAAIGIWLHKLERGPIEGFFIPEARIPHEVVASTVKQVEDAGLNVSHLVLTGFYTLPELADRIDHTLHAMEVAAALGAECVVVAPGRREGRSYEETRDLRRARPQRGLRAGHATGRAARGGADHRVAERLPQHPRRGGRAGRARRPSDLGVYPDSFHLWRTGTMLEDIDRAADRIFGVHLNDAVTGDDHHNRLPGQRRATARRDRASHRSDGLPRHVRQRADDRPGARARPDGGRRPLRPCDGRGVGRGRRLGRRLSAVGDHTHLPIVTSQDHFHRLTASPGSPSITEFEPWF